MKVARLIGGAGTGKTTELLRIMENALQTLKDPTLLGFASFTRAARAEAVSRACAAWGVSEELLSGKGWFRTVHSTVLRCLGSEADKIISDKKQDLEWISNIFGIKLSTEIDDMNGSTRYLGDRTIASSLSIWSRARVSLEPVDSLVRRYRRIDDSVPDYAKVVSVAERYETAKRLDGRMDFEDSLLRFAGVRVSPRSGVSLCTPLGAVPAVSAWLFDEQQDASPIVDLVCKRLVEAPTVKWCYVVGDPFQSIYGFAGSSSKCFMAWPAEKERIMPKSYRCPKPILALGEKCLADVDGYFDRGIAPADHDGKVTEINGIESIADIVKPDEDWLLIARTNYHARRIAAALNASRKPFRWTNTGHDDTTDRAIGLTALWALENGESITGHEWRAAMNLLPQKGSDGETYLIRGTRSQWNAKPEYVEKWDRIFPEDMPEVGATELLVNRLRSGEWVKLVDRGSQWREMVKRHGVKLASDPRVRIGTIHSAKGAEAENVVVLTASSKIIADSASTDKEILDEERRLAYVAVTRAKRNLFIATDGIYAKTPRMEMPI